VCWLCGHVIAGAGGGRRGGDAGNGEACLPGCWGIDLEKESISKQGMKRRQGEERAEIASTPWRLPEAGSSYGHSHPPCCPGPPNTWCPSTFGVPAIPQPPGPQKTALGHLSKGLGLRHQAEPSGCLCPPLLLILLTFLLLPLLLDTLI
jgi:hypothetical protein